MKVFLKIFGVLFFLTILYSCNSSSTKSRELSNYIPENASVVFKIQDFETLESYIKNNGFLSQLKNTKPYTFFSERSLIKYLHPDSTSLLCISVNKEITDYTFITKQTDGLFELDSIPEKTIERMNYKKHTLQLVVIDDQQIFTTIKDSVFIASSSRQIVQNLLEGKTKKELIFQKIYEIKNTSDFTSIFSVNNISLNDSVSLNFASWVALDVEILPDAITASGVVLKKDSVPQLLSAFKGLVPQKNNVAKITPSDALSVVSLTYNDFEVFQNNLQRFRAIKINDSEGSNLYESISEISKIEVPQGNAIILSSVDPSLTNDAITKFTTQKETFKEVLISEFNKPDLFTNLFTPLLKNIKPNFVFKLDQFFIFSESIEVSKHIITSFLNNNCLSTTVYYQEALSHLSDESSLLIMK